MKTFRVEDDDVARYYVLLGLRGAGHAVDEMADDFDGRSMALTDCPF